MKSMFLSLTALIVAALALINSVCGFQDSTLVISFLGVLVTLLVGWNIIQYIFAKDTMEKIAKEVSEPIAAEAAKKIADDINHIFEGKRWMQKANSFSKPGENMQRIDMVFNALNEYSKCRFLSASQSSVDAALQNLQRRLEDMKGEIAPRVLEGKKTSYAVILKALHSPYLQACSALLDKAKEMPKEYDSQVLSLQDSETLIAPQSDY